MACQLRTAILIAALVQPHQGTTVAEKYLPWERLGEPCSTETDRREGTCVLKVDAEWKGRRVANPVKAPMKTYWSK